jgi:dipeptide/tripeptide permease
VVEGYTPEQVEEVRMVVRLLPVFFTTILYWTVYAQMGTFFIMQARCCCAVRASWVRTMRSGC